MGKVGDGVLTRGGKLRSACLVHAYYLKVAAIPRIAAMERIVA